MTGKAKSRFQTLDANRRASLNRSRECADLTLPALLPPDGHNETQGLPTPYQSLGARAVNNISSKLLLALFPPGTSFARLTANPTILERIGVGENDERVVEALRRVEGLVMREIENGPVRNALFVTLKLLATTGDACLYLPRKDDPQVFRKDQYVIVRDASGKIIEAAIKETVAPETLTPEVMAACGVAPKGDNPGEPKSVDIFTHIKRDGAYMDYWQEINEIEVPGTRGRRRDYECPYLFLRWSASPGESYGRGLVEEYLGDLRSLEGLTKAVVKFSAAVSKIVFLMHPNSVTDEDALVEAESGDFVTGRREDIDVLQIEKFADFQVAKATIDDITLRLSHAFLLQSGTIRDAERVTAEEIRAMAQELEDVLGGVYTMLGETLQLPLVQRILANLREDGRLSQMSAGVGGEAVLEPRIITGFDALGRGHELNRFRAAFQDLVGFVGPEEAIDMLDSGRVAVMLQQKHNVDLVSLMKDPETRENEANQRQMAAMAEKAAGPAAGALARGGME